MTAFTGSLLTDRVGCLSFSVFHYSNHKLIVVLVCVNQKTLYHLEIFNEIQWRNWTDLKTAKLSLGKFSKYVIYKGVISDSSRYLHHSQPMVMIENSFTQQLQIVVIQFPTKQKNSMRPLHLFFLIITTLRKLDGDGNHNAAKQKA